MVYFQEKLNILKKQKKILFNITLGNNLVQPNNDHFINNVDADNLKAAKTIQD